MLVVSSNLHFRIKQCMDLSQYYVFLLILKEIQMCSQDLFILFQHFCSGESCGH